MVFGLISTTQLLNIPFIIAGFIVLYFALNGKLRYQSVANG